MHQKYHNLNILAFLVNYNELLYNAIKNNDLDMVKELLKNQTTLVNEHVDGESRWVILWERYNQPEGCDCVKCEWMNVFSFRTPLYVAVEEGNMDMVNLILEHNPDVNAKGPEDR